MARLLAQLAVLRRLILLHLEVPQWMLQVPRSWRAL
jgi:hypothetical protein